MMHSIRNHPIYIEIGYSISIIVYYWNGYPRKNQSNWRRNG